MFSQRLLVASFSMLALALASVTADAQIGTGPISKSGGAPKPMPGVQAAVQVLTAERVVSLLQAKGAEAKVTGHSEVKGTKFTVVKVKMQADDFGYDFNVVLMTQPNGIKSWYMSADLNTKGLELSLEKLQGLMKINYNMGTFNSFMIDNTGFLMIQSARFGISQTDQTFLNETNIYMKNIKSSYDYWKTGE